MVVDSWGWRTLNVGRFLAQRVIVGRIWAQWLLTAGAIFGTVRHRRAYLGTVVVKAGVRAPQRRAIFGTVLCRIVWVQLL